MRCRGGGSQETALLKAPEPAAAPQCLCQTCWSHSLPRDSIPGTARRSQTVCRGNLLVWKDFARAKCSVNPIAQG